MASPGGSFQGRVRRSPRGSPRSLFPNPHCFSDAAGKVCPSSGFPPNIDAFSDFLAPVQSHLLTAVALAPRQYPDCLNVEPSLRSEVREDKVNRNVSALIPYVVIYH